VARSLSDRFRCFVPDRRGRGDSGPAGNHSLVRECEDLEAVLALAGSDATLLGASYGAVVALETALRVQPRRLVIYEPPLILGADSPIRRAVEESFPAYEKLTAEGRLDEALALGLEKLAGVPAPVVEDMRTSSPEAWRTMRELTPSWVPEVHALSTLPFGVERYRGLGMPTLLLTGSESVGFLRDVIAVLDETIPNSIRLELAGHGHEAHLTAPELLAAGVARFIGAQTGPS
jgi:pimeloyl-ACP methyl ester carboxylesterase